MMPSDLCHRIPSLVSLSRSLFGESVVVVVLRKERSPRRSRSSCCDVLHDSIIRDSGEQSKIKDGGFLSNRRASIFHRDGNCRQAATHNQQQKQALTLGIYCSGTAIDLLPFYIRNRHPLPLHLQGR
jgi:hypothetical protein